jgi:DNA replication protein DnaC
MSGADLGIGDAKGGHESPSAALGAAAAGDRMGGFGPGEVSDEPGNARAAAAAGRARAPAAPAAAALRKAAPEVLATAASQRWQPAEVLRMLLEEEAKGRDRAGVRNRRRASGLPAGKTFEARDEQAAAIPKHIQQALRTLEWIDRAEALCVCGPSGTGKSHFVEALGHLAIERGKTVAWHTLESLEGLVRRRRADDAVTKAIAKLIRCDLLIVDDVGKLPVSPDTAEALFRVVDAAYERRSLALTSNIHPSGFDELMPRASPPPPSTACSTTPTWCSPKEQRATASPKRPPGRGWCPGLTVRPAALAAPPSRYALGSAATAANPT